MSGNLTIARHPKSLFPFFGAVSFAHSSIEPRFLTIPFEDTSMKKSLLLASLIAAMALAACGKKAEESAVAEAASAASEAASAASAVAEVASDAAASVAASASEAASAVVEGASAAADAAASK
ncbi:hypothetical protein [Aquabacterium sp. CECT 9606]|uniref:hypothetical protein n=1 Tax=Aquabacterium sp. CECT 9606 TaxID=2845822 RepID=UPI00352FFE96